MGLTKEEKTKRDDAKKRIDELFGDLLSVDSKNVVAVADKIEELNNTKSTKTTTGSGGKQVEWLKSEIEKVNVKNEELEKALIQKTKDYENLLNSSRAQANSPNAQVDNGKAMNFVKGLFNELDGMYQGRRSPNNPEGARYDTVKVVHILNKLVEAFPNLMPKR